MLNTIREVFAYHLQRLRGDRDLKEIAGGAGIPYRTYQNMENGVIPQGETLRKISAFWGIPETAFFIDPDLTRRPDPEDCITVLSEFIRSKKASPK